MEFVINLKVVRTEESDSCFILRNKKRSDKLLFFIFFTIINTPVVIGQEAPSAYACVPGHITGVKLSP